MNALRQAAQLTIGFVVTALALVLAAALGLAFLGIAVVTAIGAAVALRLTGRRMPRASARMPHSGGVRAGRVWHDGKGKVIDM